MSSTDVSTEIQRLVDGAYEQGRTQGQEEVGPEFLRTSLVTVIAGMLAEHLRTAAQRIRVHSADAAEFFNEKADELSAFATPPTLVASQPQADQTNVPVNSVIVLTFDSPLREGELGKTITLGAASGGPKLGASLAHEPSTNTVMLTPEKDLSPRTEYKVTVAGVANVGGLKAEETSFTFTTEKK